jgi:peptide/nickel transport system substrate-binding protein
VGRRVAPPPVERGGAEVSTTPRTRVSLALATAATLVMSLLPATVTAAEPVFKIGITQTATDGGLNPFLATAGADYRLITDVYDLLIEFGPDLKPAAGLAETWETSTDGLTWTYHIRDDAMWHDGQPVTAEDVVFTFEYIRNSQNPAYKGPAAPDGNDLSGAEEEGAPPEPDGSADNPITLFDNALDLDAGFEETRITSITAPDPQTVVIVTTEPLIIMSQIYIPILPKHIWETIPYSSSANDYTNYDPAKGIPVGSGPFIVKEFKPDEFMRLEANADYWAGAPKIGELLYQYFENDEAAVAALQNGEVHMLDAVPGTLVETLEADDNVTVVRSPSTDFAELGFNSWNPTPERFADEGCADCPKGPTTGSMGDPWLTRPDVRAALAQLVDKKELVDRALNGFGTPGISVVGPLTEFYHFLEPADDPATYPGSREAANTRFTTAMQALGFSDTDGNGILNVPATADATAFDPAGAGKDWSLRLFIRDDDEEDKIAGELFETWFEDAGVSIDRQEIKEDPTLYDATYPSSSNADMDMYIWGWGPDPDPDFILSVFACNQINNWQDVNYCDEAYDAEYVKSRTATDLNERQTIIKALQAKAYTEAPYAVLWYTDGIEAYRKDLFEGFVQHPAGNGSVWSTWAFGPYGSRLTVTPFGTGPSPTDGASPGAPGSPGASPTAAPSTPGAGGSGNLVPLVVGGGLLAAAVVAGVLYMRRRAAVDEE